MDTRAMRARLAELADQAQAIDAASRAEGRDFTAGEQEQIAEIYAEFQRVESDLAAALRARVLRVRVDEAIA
jgi:hypothetical protein